MKAEKKLRTPDFNNLTTSEQTKIENKPTNGNVDNKTPLSKKEEKIDFATELKQEQENKRKEIEKNRIL